jgi:hypothetical protein
MLYDLQRKLRGASVRCGEENTSCRRCQISNSAAKRTVKTQLVPWAIPFHTGQEQRTVLGPRSESAMMSDSRTKPRYTKFSLRSDSPHGVYCNGRHRSGKYGVNAEDEKYRQGVPFPCSYLFCYYDTIIVSELYKMHLLNYLLVYNAV